MGALRKSSRSLSHLLMSSCLVLITISSKSSSFSQILSNFTSPRIEGANNKISSTYKAINRPQLCRPMPTLARSSKFRLHTICQSATKFGNVGGLVNRNLFPEFHVITCGDMHQSFTGTLSKWFFDNFCMLADSFSVLSVHCVARGLGESLDLQLKLCMCLK